MLWAIKAKLPQSPAPPNPGLTSFTPAPGDGPCGFLEAACFRIVAGRAVRLDILDRIAEVLATASKERSDADQSLNTLVSLLGSNTETAIAVATGLGWKRAPAESSDPPILQWQQNPQPQTIAAPATTAGLSLCGSVGAYFDRLARLSEFLRIDKWLWHARFCKTRALAQQKATQGQIRLNGQRVEQPGAAVRVGDVMTFPSGGEVIAVRVTALGVRRGPATEARMLYDILAE